MSDLRLSQEPVMCWKELAEADDTHLILQLIAGNHDALAVMVDRYQQLVLSVARRIVKDESEAEEVVQTVFLEVFRHPAQFDPRRGTLKMWLLQFAYSRSINRREHLERRKFYSQVDLDVVELAESRASLRESRCRLSSAETARLVRQALHVLNDRQRRALELMYFHGLTLNEAAQEAGETVSAMRHHYYRGMMKLREFVQRTRLVQENEPAVRDEIGLEVGDADPRPI
jgi:RNA polymerase sigma-70 factor (ECF subfamily)